MWKDSFIQYLRYEKNYSSHTEISYLNDLLQFEKFIITKIDEFKPEAITPKQIRIWMSYLMENGYNARSVNRKLSALKTFFKYQKKKGVVPTNPTELIAGVKEDKKLPSFAGNADIAHILDTRLNDSEIFEEARDLFLIELLYLTGMRRSELIGLKNNDIDFDNKTLRVTGKRNKQRLIPFSDKTAQLIENYLLVRDNEIENKSPYLFVKKDGEPLYPKMVYNIIHKRLANISTLSKKSPHTLRHSFATEMLNNGAEINAVKELLGHTSLSSTQIYTHVSLEEIKKTYQKAHPREKK